MFVSINTELLIFQNYCGFVCRLCKGNGSNRIAHFKCLCRQHCVASNTLPSSYGVERACCSCICRSASYQSAEVFSPGDLRCIRPIFSYTTKRPDTKLGNNIQLCMSRLWDATIGTVISIEPDISALMERGNIKMKAAQSDKSLINVCNY
jgi:hypothetical protein